MRRLAVQGFVRQVVVDLKQVVAQPQGEGSAVGVHVRSAIERAQHPRLGRAVEALDGAVPFGVLRPATDGRDAQALTDCEHIQIFEGRPAVPVQQVHQSVGPDHVVQQLQQRRGLLARGHEDVQAEAMGVVEQIQCRPLVALGSGAEVLEVRERHLHPRRIAEASLVRVRRDLAGSGLDAVELHRPPDRGAVERLGRGDDLVLLGAA